MELELELQRALGSGYVLERELGGGGMSRVFVALETALGRHVVVKVFPSDLDAGSGIDRFRREILLLAQLQHSHIVPLLAAGEAEGRPFFTMPLVAGESVAAALARSGPLPGKDVVRILRDVALALAYAHARGVVHRDLKPDNILLSDGTVMVTDFGIAKALLASREGERDGSLTLAGTSLGTPAYMAPEQWAGDPAADHRVDLYALGVTAYEMISGARPFGGSPQALLKGHMTELPPPLRARRPDVPASMVALVEALLAKDPAHRPAVEDVLRALDQGWAPSFRGRIRAPAGRRRVAAAASCGLLGVLVWAWAARSRRPAEVAGVERSVAVLPLVNRGGGPAQDYFVDGMTDEVTAALSRVPGLRVVSRTSAFAYKGRTDLDIREIGRRLGAGTILEGAVRRDGPRLRASVQLTNATTGAAIWAETYQRGAADAFEVQESIASAIAGALRMTFDQSTERRQRRRGTRSTAAYDSYLRGRYVWRQRGEQSLHRAVAYFREAIAADSEYAQAYAGLADALILLPVYGLAPADSAIPAAARAAERAIALDSTSAEAYTTLAAVRKSVGAWAKSDQAFRKALQLDPNYSTAHQWYGELLLVTGRVDSAVAEMKRAVSGDPVAPLVAAELGYFLALAGRLDSAIAQGQRAIDLAPDLWTGHAFLGSVYAWAGRYDDGARELERALALDSNAPFQGALAYTYAKAGRVGRARRILQTLLKRGRPGANPQSTEIAVAYAGLGAVPEALDWLERAAAAKDPLLYETWLGTPWFQSLRSNPRFQSVVAQLGVNATPGETHVRPGALP